MSTAVLVACSMPRKTLRRNKLHLQGCVKLRPSRGVDDPKTLAGSA
jgi:hypothetical protein